MTSEGATAARTRVGRVLRPGFDSSRGELIAGLVWAGALAAFFLASAVWNLVRHNLMGLAFSVLMALAPVPGIRDGLYLLRRDRVSRR